ncbi:MAG: DNA gyrase C-terminal beta-propeller domain-containing protein, partial [Polyangiales bacterium]
RLMKLPLTGLEEFVKRAGRPEAEIQAAKARGEYFLSERQAKAILEMRLSRLTGLEREKLATEYGSLCDLIGELEAILASKTLLDEVIVNELDEIRERFGDARRTEIVEAEGDISIEDLVPDEEVVVTVSHAGYVKRVPLSEYRAQGRGGKGLRAMDTRDQDFVSWVFVVNAHANVLFLSDKGKAYLKKVYQIPETSRAARGRAVVNLVGMEPDERVAAILPIREFVDDGYLLTCTRGGRVKRTSLSAYANIRQTGIIGVAIGDGDALLAARIVTPAQHVLIGTSRGMSIRFAIEDVRPMGRDSMGVKGVDLREGDLVIGMDIIEDESEQQVLTVSANGYGKRTRVAEWRTQNRGGKGIIAMDTSERNGALVKLRLVSPEDQLMVITNGGQVIRTRVSEIRETGRNTQGVRVIRLRDGEQVVDVEPVAEGEEVDEQGDEVVDTGDPQETQGN